MHCCIHTDCSCLQVTDAPSHSGDAGMSVHLQPPTTAQTNPSLSQQPEVRTHRDQRHTHTSGATLTDVQTSRGDTAKRSHSRHGLAVQVHAGHAGLLRFKRQWPVPRPLMLSDSDDSDSLSDFDSIADFHIEAAADERLVHQDACRGPAAVCLSGSPAIASVVNSSKAVEAGRSSERPHLHSSNESAWKAKIVIAYT